MRHVIEGTMRHKILLLLAKHPDSDASVADIRDALQLPTGGARVTLARMYAHGELIRTEYGRYRLAQLPDTGIPPFRVCPYCSGPMPGVPETGEQ